MSTVPDTITNAAAATDKISAEVDRVMAILHDMQGCTINRHGVYSDPSSCYRALTEAQASLNRAWNAARATTWPTQADYETAE